MIFIRRIQILLKLFSFHRNLTSSLLCHISMPNSIVFFQSQLLGCHAYSSVTYGAGSG